MGTSTQTPFVFSRKSSGRSGYGIRWKKWNFTQLPLVRGSPPALSHTGLAGAQSRRTKESGPLSGPALVKPNSQALWLPERDRSRAGVESNEVVARVVELAVAARRIDVR